MRSVILDEFPEDTSIATLKQECDALFDTGEYTFVYYVKRNYGGGIIEGNIGDEPKIVEPLRTWLIIGDVHEKDVQ